MGVHGRAGAMRCPVTPTAGTSSALRSSTRRCCPNGGRAPTARPSSNTTNCGLNAALQRVDGQPDGAAPSACRPVPMQIVDHCSADDWKRSFKCYGKDSVVVALGKFDALHLGHQQLVLTAASMGYPFLLSFAGMAEVLGWPSRLPLVADADRPRVLRSWGTACGGQVPLQRLIPFKEIRNMSPQQFVQLMVQDLEVSGVVAGSNYRFGYRAQGSAQDLQQLGAQHQVRVSIVELVVDPAAGKERKGSYKAPFQPAAGPASGSVSSSTIRQLLQAGDVQAAAQCLGRPHRLVCSTLAVSHTGGAGATGAADEAPGAAAAAAWPAAGVPAPAAAAPQQHARAGNGGSDGMQGAGSATPGACDAGGAAAGTGSAAAASGPGTQSSTAAGAGDDGLHLNCRQHGQEERGAGCAAGCPGAAPTEQGRHSGEVAATAGVADSSHGHLEPGWPGCTAPSAAAATAAAMQLHASGFLSQPPSAGTYVADLLCSSGTNIDGEHEWELVVEGAQVLVNPDSVCVAAPAAVLQRMEASQPVQLVALDFKGGACV